jgi:hypothetical protein
VTPHANQAALLQKYPSGWTVVLPTITFDRNKSKREDLFEEAKRMADDHSSWPKQGP